MIMENKTELKESCPPVGMARRLWYLDCLKLIAAFFVVFYHLAYYDLNYGFEPGVLYIANGNRILMSFAACSVPLFFTVNGTLLFRRHRTWQEMLHKAVKILVLLLIWKLVDFPDWFFRTMIILYLVFPGLQYLQENRPGLLKLLCCAVFVMPFGYNLALMCCKGLALVGWIPDVTKGLSVTGCFTVYSILYFCMGCYLEQTKPWKLMWSVVCVLAGWFLVVTECMIYTNLYQVIWDGVNAAFPTAGAFLMTLGLYSAMRSIPKPSFEKLLAWCADGVLAIYLQHMALIRLLKDYLLPDSYGIMSAVMVTVIVCGLCILVRKLCRNIRVLDWLFRI